MDDYTLKPDGVVKLIVEVIILIDKTKNDTIGEEVFFCYTISILGNYIWWR